MDKELQILYAALAAHFGIVLRTTNYQRGLAALYRAKRQDEAFEVLSFRRSPTDPEQEIWIIKTGSIPASPPPAPPGSLRLADILGD